MFEVYDALGSLSLSTADSTMRLLAVIRVDLPEGETGQFTLPNWASGTLTVVFVRDYLAEDQQVADWSLVGLNFSYTVPYPEVAGYFYVLVR